MSQTANRWLGLLPGLLMGAAGVAKDQGWIGGGSPLPANVQAGNDTGWANMGRGLNADGTQNTNFGFAPHAPMQLPGATLASGNAPPQLPSQASPNASSHAFGLGAQGGGLANGLAGLPAFAAMQPQMHQMPPQAQPQAPIAGLLSDPNEQSRRVFGIGPAMNIRMG